MVPLRWRRRVLTCRPGVDAAARDPRPVPLSPDDLLALVERLVVLGPPALPQADRDGATSLAQRRQRSELDLTKASRQ